MAQRRRITICREGWYYLTVLSIIILGAVLRQVNLLVILAGLMIAPVVLNWRLVAETVRRLVVRRKLPAMICAGDPLAVEVTLANERMWLSGWAFVVRDSIQLIDDQTGKFRTTVDLLLPFVAARGSAVAGYRADLSRRGKYRLGPMQISTRFPFGIIQAAVRASGVDTLLVGPRLGRLTNRWVNLIEADRAGAERAQRRQGIVEGDYYGLREFRTGDSIRWIHWRTSAKLSELTVCQFELQRNRDVAIVLDLWQPDRPTPNDLDRVELAVSFGATAVVDLCRRGGSQLLVAGGGIDFEPKLIPSSTMVMQDVLERLATVAGGRQEETAGIIEKVSAGVPRGTRIVVVSTRASLPATKRPFDDRSADSRAVQLSASLTWIDVTDDRLADLFQID